MQKPVATANAIFRVTVPGGILIASAAIACAFVVADFHPAIVARALPAIGAVLAISIGLLFLGVSIFLGGSGSVRATVAEAAAELAAQAIAAKAQNALEAASNQLRDVLYGYGEPRRRDDKLYFGNTAVNGNFEAVDRVKTAFGATATIFMGDERISTNVQKPDGSRAIGTRLASGPVSDAVLGHGRTYRGEAEILGEQYYTLYEPITRAGTTIGILYVGLKKSDFSSRLGTADTAGRRRRVTTAVALAQLQSAAAARREADHEALVQRQEADEVRRRYAAARERSAEAQHSVVAALSIALERLSAGYLDTPIADEFPAEYAGLKVNYNDTLESLTRSIEGIARVGGSLMQGIVEIAGAADDFSRRTEQQAASLEETAAAVDKISATVEKTADGADKTSAMVVATKSDAEQSGDIVKQAVEAMGIIAKSSAQISDIIGLIDEIAFQTNLLALNAGVEAARAGDSGRGFAVVATEVRALAQRSAGAAREIKNVISASQRQVGAGVKLVSETGDALERIVRQVAQINSAVVGIAASARENATRLAQVNAAVTEIDQVTQQNAAMVEESTDASRAMAQQAEELAALVAHFKIADTAVIQNAAPRTQQADREIDEGEIQRERPNSGELQLSIPNTISESSGRAVHRRGRL
jgi:methyl-accepting chemotaxis protein